MRVERVSARPPNNWKKRLKNRNPRVLSHATRTRDPAMRISRNGSLFAFPSPFCALMTDGLKS